MKQQRVLVYRNLNASRSKGVVVYSVMDKKTRRVIAHATDVLLRDVEFKVNEAGRQRVLRERRKNVHSFVEGWISTSPVQLELMESVTYNPFKFTSFVRRHNEEPIRRSPMCLLSQIGVVAVIPSLIA